MTNDEADEAIVVLDDETVNKIAAGEVIERPASVVKELVENSIDAGASGITIELSGAPGDFIRVSDDGCGMSRKDASRAFLRHATSKIRTASDLHDVLTMGFRGEALASIASVARVELTTRRSQDGIGTRVLYEGGALVLEEEAACPVGTRVTCRDLFFNTPARRKFQKRPPTELGRVYDVVGRLALARPDVRLRFLNNGKEALISQGLGDRRATIAAVHGAALARALAPVVAGSVRTHVDGFVSPPDLARATRDSQCIFVNARPTVAPSLARVIENAYGKRLPAGRHPAFFLWLTADPSSVDVNVHPAKREVRFSHDHEVFELVARAVSAAVRSPATIPGEGDGFWRRAPATREADGEMGPGARGAAPGVASHAGAGGESGDALVREGAERYLETARFTRLGTFLGTYILAADGPDLVVIDQHAAHERVLYESVLDALSSGAPDIQTLLPVALELGAATVANVGRRTDALARIGILLEEFGPTSLLLRGIPAPLARPGKANANVVEAVSAALQALADDMGRGEPDLQSVLDRFAAELACKAAVKARETLEPAETERLLSDLGRARDPYSCPHGRPTMLRVGRSELERAFRRR